MTQAAGDGLVERTVPGIQADKVRRWALPLGVLVLFIDGYDLFVLGTAGPSLLAYQPWHASPGTLGLLGSVTGLGMPFGAFAAGRASDTWGRRLPITVFLVWVSVCMVISGLAPNLLVFGVGRFLTGIGIGALTPLIVAYVADWCPPQRRTLHVGFALTGIAFGGVVVAFIGRAMLPELHFQWLFLMGALPLCLAPICWKVVPAQLPGRDVVTEPGSVHTRQEAGKPLRELFVPGWRGATILLSVATFFGIVLVYGASTWLPTLLTRSGYDLHSALEFTVAFNAGAIIGTLAAAMVADRGFLKSSTVLCFCCAAIAMLVLSTPHARGVVLIMSAVAGLGTLGTQNLINGYVSHYYPARLRGTALGTSLGFGRIGSIVGPSYVTLVAALIIAPSAGFYGFVVPAVLGAAAIAFVPAHRRRIRAEQSSDTRLPGAQR